MVYFNLSLCKSTMRLKTSFCVELGANIAGGRAEREEESTSGVSTYNSQHSHPEDIPRGLERLESRDGGVYLQLRMLEDENRRLACHYILLIVHLCCYLVH